MLGKVSPLDVQITLDHCQQDNASAAAVLSTQSVGLRTDVTGFGLLGHLQTTLPHGLGATIDASTVPLLPGAVEAYRRGVRPTILEANQRVTQPALSDGLTAEVSALLHDPQTSGGLLISLPQEQAEQAVSALVKAGYTQASIIGSLTANTTIEVRNQWG